MVQKARKILKRRNNETLKLQNDIFGEYIVGLVDHDKAINVTRDRILKELLNKND